MKILSDEQILFKANYLTDKWIERYTKSHNKKPNKLQCFKYKLGIIYAFKQLRDLNIRRSKHETKLG